MRSHFVSAANRSHSLSRIRPLPFLLAFALFISALFFPTSALAMPGDDPGMVKFRGAAFPVAEEAGEVTVVVKRLRGDDGEVSVGYELLEGTATDGVDYIGTSGVLTWDDGDKSDKSFTVEILDDDEAEGQETFGFRLIDPTGDVEIGNPSTTTVRIKPSDQDDDDDGDGDDGDPGDDEAGFIKLTAAGYSAFESAGVAEVEVERTDGSTGEVTVDYMTVPGSAQEGTDYFPTTGTLTWADGDDGVQVVMIPLVDDTEAEDLETISFLLTNATGGAQLGVRDLATVTIIDDDGGSGDCVPDDTTLCLQDGRFQVVGSWEDFDGNTGPMHWIPASDETGFAWFFNESNFELLLKILDACSFNGHYWVFYAATTNVGFEIEVTDLQSGDVETYTNPLGTAANAVTDTTAFDTCD